MFKYFEQEKDTLEFRAGVERQVDICTSPKYGLAGHELRMNVFGNAFGILISMAASSTLETGELEVGMDLYNQVMEARGLDPITLDFVLEQVAILKDPTTVKSK